MHCRHVTPVYGDVEEKFLRQHYPPFSRVIISSVVGKAGNLHDSWNVVAQFEMVVAAKRDVWSFSSLIGFFVNLIHMCQLFIPTIFSNQYLLRLTPTRPFKFIQWFDKVLIYDFFIDVLQHFGISLPAFLYKFNKTFSTLKTAEARSSENVNF